MKRKKIKILVSAFLLFTCYFPLATFSYAASFEFLMDGSPVRVGDTVQIPVYINGNGESVFVAQASVLFPRNIFWVKSFTLAPGWLPVLGEEYQLLDNGRGALLKTAGFEGGVAGRVLLGTIEGIATGEGVAPIYADNSSFLLGKENKKIFSADTKQSFDADESADESPDFVSSGTRLGREQNSSAWLKIHRADKEGDLPSSLFDIRLEVAKSVIAPAESLVARVLFQSFGNVPTPVDMFFTITDDAGKVFTSFQGSAVVETESVFTKQFDGLNLPVGKYILHASTRYKADVKDEFSAPFSVEPGVRFLLIISGLIFMLGVSGTTFFIWRRKKHLSAA